MIKSNCEVCGKEIISIYASAPRKYCEECKVKVRREKNKIRARIYKKSKRGIAKIKAYVQTDYHKQKNIEYNNTQEGKKVIKKAQEKYRKTKTYKEKQKRFEAQPHRIKYVYDYNHSLAGKQSRMRRRHQRRLNEKKVFHNFTPKQWEEKLEKTEGFCLRCKNYIGIMELTLDHIIPLSKVYEGFIYTIHDVQPLCFLCNARKVNQLEVIYLPYKPIEV